jgi:hypothetical protein
MRDTGMCVNTRLYEETAEHQRNEYEKHADKLKTNVEFEKLPEASRPRVDEGKPTERDKAYAAFLDGLHDIVDKFGELGASATP